ncbi:unnamed protein product, partial [Rotaria sp. Silwood1]
TNDDDFLVGIYAADVTRRNNELLRE